MKNWLLFTAFALTAACSLQAQTLTNSDLVGTWDHSGNTFTFQSNGYIDIEWKDGSDDYWKWHLEKGRYSYSGNTSHLTVGNTRYVVDSFSGGKFVLKDLDSSSRYSFEKRRASGSNEPEMSSGEALLWGLGALILLGIMSDNGGSDSYDSGSYRSACSTCGGRGYISHAGCPSGCPCGSCNGSGY